MVWGAYTFHAVNYKGIGIENKNYANKLEIKRSKSGPQGRLYETKIVLEEFASYLSD